MLYELMNALKNTLSAIDESGLFFLVHVLLYCIRLYINLSGNVFCSGRDEKKTLASMIGKS